jgi:hypothetical protein
MDVAARAVDSVEPGELLAEGARLAGVASGDARVWLRTQAFNFHLSQYTKSRRKAPLYWQLSVPSGSYSVWLYYPRLEHDSFFKVQNDLVIPKLRHEESKLERLRKEGGQSPTTGQRKEIGAQETFVEELRAFLDEVKRVAPLWNPNLDDGAIINFAPLWRLVPQHRDWQKDCKGTWDELCDGEYDWSHLAMHLWPGRVVPKCQADRSLAIAHNLEEVFWVEDAKGKWQPRQTPTKSIDALVRERTSPAVKAALEGLLNASDPGRTAATRRGAGGRKPRKGGR